MKYQVTSDEEQFLRKALTENLVAHNRNEAIQLDNLTANGWLKKVPFKVRRGTFKADHIYILSSAGKNAAEKILGEGQGNE